MKRNDDFVRWGPNVRATGWPRCCALTALGGRTERASPVDCRRHGRRQSDHPNTDASTHGRGRFDRGASGTGTAGHVRAGDAGSGTHGSGPGQRRIGARRITSDRWRRHTTHRHSATAAASPVTPGHHRRRRRRGDPLRDVAPDAPWCHTDAVADRIDGDRRNAVGGRVAIGRGDAVGADLADPGPAVTAPTR